MLLKSLGRCGGDRQGIGEHFWYIFLHLCQCSASSHRHRSTCDLTIYRLLLLSSQQFSWTIWGNGLHKNFENRFSQTIWEKWISQTNWDNGFYKQFENTVFTNNFRKRVFFLQIILENIFHKQFMKTVYTISSLKRFSQAIWENGFNEQF